MTKYTAAPKAKEAAKAADIQAEGLSVYRVFWLFLMASFLGDMIEVAFWLVTRGELVSRSSLVYGPFSLVGGLGAVVLGVSRDSSASHLRFIQKNGLPFRLLSDPERTALEAYGVWQEKKLYGKVSMGVVRSTYLIDEQGMIEKVMPKVKPDTNAAETLAYLNGEG